MNAKSAQADKDKGNAAFKAGDYPLAIGHYSAAILADQRNPTYPLNRAAAYLKLGKNEDAERDCTTVLLLDPRNVKALFRRGQARVGMQKLQEAEDDFRQALTLDPANEAAKTELKKVSDLLQTQKKQPKKQPVDISDVTSAQVPPPKRRRVPITIVEPPAASSSTSKATPSDALLTPVSSRSLSAHSTSVPQPKAAPSTFKDAKSARESARGKVGGGIFRRDGHHTIFEPKSVQEAAPPSRGSTEDVEMASVAPEPESSASAPSKPIRIPTAADDGAKPLMTLFAFKKQWDRSPTPEDRWALLCDVPPAALPGLFQNSLEAGLLAAILSTLLAVLHASQSDAVRARVRAYMLALPRVPRFGTVHMFLSREERAMGKAVWELVGGGEEGKIWS